MPRGKYTNHKGRNRRFTSPEELEQQQEQEEKEKSSAAWRRRHEQGNRDMPPSDSSEEEDEESEDGSEDEDGESKAKGVESVIQIENPNRVQKKEKKSTEINAESDKPELSRKEREEIEKQRATLHYRKLHAEGKTDEARADLARLAIIRQQREEAAQRRELEKKGKEKETKK